MTESDLQSAGVAFDALSVRRESKFDFPRNHAPKPSSGVEGRELLGTGKHSTTRDHRHRDQQLRERGTETERERSRRANGPTHNAMEGPPHPRGPQ